MKVILTSSIIVLAFTASSIGFINANNLYCTPQQLEAKASELSNKADAKYITKGEFALLKDKVDETHTMVEALYNRFIKVE